MSSASTARAPGRVNLIGEHVDYQEGLCLPVAIPQRTTATVTVRDDDSLRFRSDDRTWTGTLADLEPGRVDGWAAYVAGVLWALDVGCGLDVQLSSDVPLGAGLSSSAALTCSVALAVDEALSLGRDRPALVQVAIRAEGEFVGAPTGGLDQNASLLCEPGQALLIDFADGTTTQVPFDPATAGLSLLVIDTQVRHEHSTGGYGERRRECEDAARQLGVPTLRQAGAGVDRLPAPLDRRARHVVSEIQRVRDFVDALHAEDWAGCGALMDASHASLRDDFEVSCAELDVAVDAARAAGAVGARMTGGGFGGSAIALVPTGEIARVTAVVEDAFAGHGWTTPTVFGVQ